MVPRELGQLDFFPHQICPDALELLGRTFSAVQLSSCLGLPGWKIGSKAWMSLFWGKKWHLCGTDWCKSRFLRSAPFHIWKYYRKIVLNSYFSMNSDSNVFFSFLFFILVGTWGVWVSTSAFWGFSKEILHFFLRAWADHLHIRWKAPPPAGWLLIWRWGGCHSTTSVILDVTFEQSCCRLCAALP